MATTTNYSWTTPDDTALVKDGASAIRTLGSSIDTTTKALNPSTTLGDIEYRSSTANTNTRLGLGTAGQVLTVNSGATAPEWATISAGGQTLISTTTLTAATSISLTSIPTTYKHLRLLFIDCFNNTHDTFWTATFNNDTGSNYSYVSSAIKSNSQTCVALGADANSSIGASKFFAPIPATNTSANNGGHNGYFDIYNYASTTLKRTFGYTKAGYSSAENCYHNGSAQGNYISTGTAITRVDFTRSASQSITGTLQLWGIS
jgi:hypothetical protein